MDGATQASFSLRNACIDALLCNDFSHLKSVCMEFDTVVKFILKIDRSDIADRLTTLSLHF